MEIVGYLEVESSHAIKAGLDSVFFGASATQAFSDDAARAQFRHRWLGRYLEQEAEHAFLALADDGTLAGYVIGALGDPARDPRCSDLGYYEDFAAFTAKLPAHLHINLAPQFRSSGIGSRLVAAFAEHAAERGAPGLHIVTGKGMRNVGFYARNGFEVLAEAPWKGSHVVLMGRTLSRPATTA